MSDKQSLDFAARVIQNLPNLPPQVMQHYIDNPKKLQRALFNIFAFPVFMRIMINTSNAIHYLHRDLLAAGIRLNDGAAALLNKLRFDPDGSSQFCGEITLVAPTVIGLGFRRPTEYSEICRRGLELGYNLCPQETGPELRLAYNDQPTHEKCIVAMEPITDHFNEPRIWSLSCDSIRQLHTASARKQQRYDLDVRVIFAVPQ